MKPDRFGRYSAQDFAAVLRRVGQLLNQRPSEETKMDDQARLDVSRGTLKIKESLDQAMEQASGAPLSAYQLEWMTALELLSLLGTNGIRFVYEPPKG